jgi:hypothetical protein
MNAHESARWSDTGKDPARAIFGEEAIARDAVL